MSESRIDRAPRFASRADLLTATTVGGIAAVWTIVQLVLRLVEVIPNRNVPVPVWIDDASATLPLPDGTADIALTSGTAIVSGMPAITLVSVAGAAIITAAASLAVIGLVLALCLNLARGRYFSTRNTLTVTAISATIAVGWFVSHLFTQMASNGAIAALTDRAYEASTIPFDWTPILAAIAVGAVAAAFRAGERLQRDTEGLV
ncbi:hypothetical protein ACFSBZ_10150 [Amnibacterium flavum]|uniref:DUF2975 domain-containing protein n=1 Tax=Amnibacterium flavum TaxID=2173173 RepID=A0A2V1HVS6_9MICO|nr:hypothetical protein [Amnibacterium flavum]PVZ95209.1 hypothetical protein DDQ50_01380 [Amnibacterium flavum]